ncbi:hypothetical protein [Streptomyces sp. NPDC002403]
MNWDMDELLSRLSAACGQAQFYCQDEHSDSMTWSVALNGVPRRRYWRNEHPEWRGEPMDWEEPLTDDSDYDHAPTPPWNATSATRPTTSPAIRSRSDPPPHCAATAGSR